MMAAGAVSSSKVCWEVVHALHLEDMKLAPPDWSQHKALRPRLTFLRILAFCCTSAL